jgi:beta-glucosidase
MELDKRPLKDESYLKNFEKHEQIALQTAREGIVLLKNENNILPVKDSTLTILAAGDIMKKRMSGGGSADVLGYDWIKMIDALQTEYGQQVNYIEKPTNEEIQNADIVICATGTYDSEGWDNSFALPDEEESRIKNIVQQNENTIIVVNSGSGIKMTGWNDQAAAILYCWYPGQMGNKALVEVISGKVCPSGKLPITIEKKFEDSPGYPYIPDGEKLYTGWEIDSDMSLPVYDIVYDEEIFVGYRWYEEKNIKPLYWFGHGLSYTTFEYDDIELSSKKIIGDEKLIVSFTIENTGDVEGAETTQLYIHDKEASVSRPNKELKGFIKVNLKPNEKRRVELVVDKKDLSFYDEKTEAWVAEPGDYSVLVGAASDKIRLSAEFSYE